MDWFSSDARVIISVLSGLLGGAVGGVATAGRIAVLGVRAKERHESAAIVRAVLSSYRALVLYDHDQVFRTDAFPSRYAGIEGQDELAESILRELPRLPRSKRKLLRKGLSNLVGELSLELAEGRVYLPRDAADPDEVRQRRLTYSVKAIHERGAAGTKGLLSELLGTQNDTSAHDAALTKTLEVLKGMLKVVRA